MCEVCSGARRSLLLVSRRLGSAADRLSAHPIGPVSGAIHVAAEGVDLRRPRRRPGWAGRKRPVSIRKDHRYWRPGWRRGTIEGAHKSSGHP